MKVPPLQPLLVGGGFRMSCVVSELEAVGRDRVVATAYTQGVWHVFGTAAGRRTPATSSRMCRLPAPWPAHRVPGVGRPHHIRHPRGHAPPAFSVPVFNAVVQCSRPRQPPTIASPAPHPALCSGRPHHIRHPRGHVPSAFSVPVFNAVVQHSRPRQPPTIASPAPHPALCSGRPHHIRHPRGHAPPALSVPVFNAVVQHNRPGQPSTAAAQGGRSSAHTQSGPPRDLRRGPPPQRNSVWLRRLPA